MSDNRFTFDSNILVYAFGRDDPGKHERAVSLIERAAERGLDCVLTLQALAEFYRVATMKKAMSLEEAESQVRTLRELFPVVAADEKALDRAMWAVRRHSFSFWDAMLWATAQEAGCVFVVSEDFAHGSALLKVAFVNPFVAEPPPPELADLLQ